MSYILQELISELKVSVHQFHAHEKEDCVFHLLRGTNIKDSFHHAINHNWPKLLNSDEFLNTLHDDKFLT